MKSIFKYFTIALLAGFACKESAQAQSQTQVLGNLVQQQNNNFDMRDRNQTMVVWLVNNYDYNYKYDFVVTMKDGSKKTVKSKIYSDNKALKTYLLFEDKKLPKSDSNRMQKIYSSQTLSIERDLGNLDVGEGTMKGLATDSCWMFKVISGPLNAYSFLSLQDDGQTFNPSSLVGVQKGDNGPIVPLDTKNMAQLVDMRDDILEYIKNGQYYKAIKKYNGDTTIK